jgi:hypothetical protein
MSMLFLLKECYNLLSTTPVLNVTIHLWPPL